MSTSAWNVGPPVCSTVDPGQCQFTGDFEEKNSVPLKSKIQVNHNTVLFTFATPDVTKPLNLSTCACILVTAPITDDAGNAVVRPYTPVSTNADIGEFQLLIKLYPNGKMSQYLNALPIGEKVTFKHIKFNVKKQYPFGKKQIGMIVGGTGITPMVQALHANLGNADDTTQVKLLYGSLSEKDVLGKEILDKWEKNPRLNVKHVLEDALGEGKKNFITGEMISEFFGPPSDDMMVWVCGPPPMYTAFCGPRDKPEVTGILQTLGYTADTVYKF